MDRLGGVSNRTTRKRHWCERVRALHGNGPVEGVSRIEVSGGSGINRNGDARAFRTVWGRGFDQRYRDAWTIEGALQAEMVVGVHGRVSIVGVAGPR